MSRRPLRWTDRVTRGNDDGGMVLMVVILSMIMVTGFVTAGLAYGTASQKLSRGDQDYNSALAAAQAGVQDFIAQLNRNDNYARQNPFTDCGNVAMQGPAAPANTCGWTATTAPGWRPVDAGDPDGPAFHYDISASELDSRGTIDVRSTGRAQGETRTLQVAVGRGGSTDFLYYTDHEDADPFNEVSYPNGMHRDCANYWWGPARDAQAGSNSPRKDHGDKWGTANDCSEITFINGDEFDGKVHTNDTPLITDNGGGPKVKFKQGLQTADPKCAASLRTDSSTWKLCDRKGIGADYGSSWPQDAAPLYLEDNSAEFAGYPGCQYQGATRIVFNSNGTMRVWSKESDDLPAACGGDEPWGATVAVPNDQVVYVRASGAPRRCESKEIDGTLPLGDYERNLDYDDSYYYDENFTQETAFCGQGNVYVEGTLKGRVTVAAENSVIVTNDMTVANLNGTDMLGLVAGNSVEIYHPVLSRNVCAEHSGGKPSQRRCLRYSQDYRTYPMKSAMTDLQVHASLQALQHSIYVQSYDRGGSKGELTVIGSMAQKWRGAVGRGSNGYLKDYRYDKRLKFSSPPYFPQFINAVWSGRTTGEIPAEY